MENNFINGILSQLKDSNGDREMIDVIKNNIFEQAMQSDSPQTSLTGTIRELIKKGFESALESGNNEFSFKNPCKVNFKGNEVEVLKMYKNEGKITFDVYNKESDETIVANINDFDVIISLYPIFECLLKQVEEQVIQK